MNIVCCRLMLKWVICILSVQLTYICNVCSCGRNISSHLLWGINVILSTYVTYAIILTSTAGIIDTGTTCMFSSPILHRCSLARCHASIVTIRGPLADNFFAIYLDAILGVTLDLHTGLIEIPLPITGDTVRSVVVGLWRSTN